MKTKSNKKQLKYKCSKCGEQFTTLKDGICYSWCEGRVIPNKLFKAKAMEKPRCHEIKGIGGKVGFDKRGDFYTELDCTAFDGCKSTTPNIKKI